MKIIFDNNIWISFLIGKRLASLRTLFIRQDIEIYFCDELEREFLDVAHRPKIKKYVSEEQISRVHTLMTRFCIRAIAETLKDTIVRDPKDSYLLALSDAVQAEYLVSGDSDLTDLIMYNQTKIIDFNTAIKLLFE